MILKIIQNLRTRAFYKRNPELAPRNMYLYHNRILPMSKVDSYLGKIAREAKWEHLKDDVLDFFKRLFKRKKI